MTVIRVAAFLMFFLLPPGFLLAEEKKTETPKVTVKDLKKDPEKYHGKVVQIEGTLESDPTESLRTQVQRHYLRLVEADGLIITSYLGQPDVVKGDRVLITGTFWYSLHPPGGVTVGLKLQSPGGMVEKLPKKE
jgi:hypothetical protein